LRGIILAAGRGSRLLSLTDEQPKCLVKLLNKQLLQWQLDSLKKAGINEIMVVCGYLKEMITGAFSARENSRWKETNMVASLMCARDWLEEAPCIVSYSDIIYPPEAVLKLLGSEYPLSLLYDAKWLDLWKQRFTNPLMDAESFAVNEKGFVVDIGRKNVSMNQIHGQYMGLLKFTPESARWIKDLLSIDKDLCDRLDLTGLLYELIKEGYSVRGISWDGAWCEIDTPSDLIVAQRLFE